MLILQPVADRDCYEYLGIDQDISYNCPLNKEKVTKEYLMRVKKIWSSELSNFNKVITHNGFTLPVIMPTAGVIDWSIDDIK